MAKLKVTLKALGRLVASAPGGARRQNDIAGARRQNDKAAAGRPHKSAPTGATRAHKAALRAARRPPHDLSTPGGQGHALAETVVMGIFDRLRQEARALDGRLTLTDLDRLADDFHDKSAALRQAFEMTFEAYARARERSKFAQNRQYPFNRLLVRRFEHLLARGKGPGIQRRVLPGFFMAVEMMLGPQILDAYQEHCRAIVERISGAQGGKFAWTDLYADAEAATLAFDALVAMAAYFADFDKRARWFLTIVNGNLGPAPANATYKQSNWQLGDAAFKNLLAALFSQLKDPVASAAARTDFTQRYGVEKCRAVADAMARIHGS